MLQRKRQRLSETLVLTHMHGWKLNFSSPPNFIGRGVDCKAVKHRPAYLPKCRTKAPRKQQVWIIQSYLRTLTKHFSKKCKAKANHCRKRHHQQSDFIRQKAASVYRSEQLVDRTFIHLHLGIIYHPRKPISLSMQTFLTFPPAPVEWHRQVQPASVACSCRRWHWQDVGHRCWRCGDAPHAAAGVGSAPRRGCAPVWCWMGEPDKVMCTVMTSMSMTHMWSAPRCCVWFGRGNLTVMCTVMISMLLTCM